MMCLSNLCLSLSLSFSISNSPRHPQLLHHQLLSQLAPQPHLPQPHLSQASPLMPKLNQVRDATVVNLPNNLFSKSLVCRLIWWLGDTPGPLGFVEALLFCVQSTSFPRSGFQCMFFERELGKMLDLGFKCYKVQWMCSKWCIYKAKLGKHR